MSLNFLKALLILGYLILLIKRELNIWMLYGIFFSIIITKTPFLNSPLISLCHKSVKGVFCTRIDIFTSGGCLMDVLVEIKWFFVIGFLVIGCFRGHPWPCFTASSTGLIGLWGTSKVGKGVFSLSGLTL